MVRSMTGYGAGSAHGGGITVSVEIRCVNHRYLDTHVRLAKEYSFLETEIAIQIREALSRGRVDVNVTIQDAETPAVQLNGAMARSYFEAASRLGQELGVGGELDLRTLLLLPGVMTGRDGTATPGKERCVQYSQLVREGVGTALHEVQVMRAREGEALKTGLLEYLASISKKSSRIRERLPEEVEEYRRRLEERIGSFQKEFQVDPQRLAMEVALLAEKSDISEELARLESHLNQFGNLAESEAEVGKRLDFLLQEMQREINTTLAKTGSMETKQLGIAIKADIEKLREQVQNVE